jgi:Ca-activated chloride channel family protein
MSFHLFRGTRRFILATALAIVALLLTPRVGRAQGLVVVSEAVPMANHFAFAPLEVTSHRVAVNIADQVAVTAVEEDIHNSTGRALEGTYIFPLPAGAHIDKFSMDINGIQADAEMLDADKARAYYEEIVRKYRDPALLEYAGRGAVRIHVFPIEANGTKHIKLQYTQALQNDSGLIEYIYPLNTEKFSSRPLRDVSVTVKITGNDPIKSIYCPTHTTTIQRDGDSNATGTYAEHNARPDTNFKLLYSTSKTEIGANLLSYKADCDDGYFMLLASPGLNSAQKVQAKDICFVLDTSGSMADDNKLPQAIKALNFCLANLNPDDRFQVIRFSSDVEPFFDERLVPADESHVAKARQFVSGLKPNGGTSLNDAVLKAISLHDPSAKRPFNIVFLTDGMPTVGETNDDRILANVRNTGGNTRVFCFGIGTDVNTHLLDGIAADTRSTSTYVVGGEDIELKVSSFFGKIRQPVLTDVTVTFDGSGIHTTQVYPNAMPDLFKGESLTIFGRYTGSGPGSVRISGTVNGEKREFVTDVKFTADSTEHAFIPQLWATRRVGWLLDEIRIHGENAELKNEIVTLARKYGIVTPYTAYLIIEDERTRGVPLSRQSFGEMSNDREALRKAESYSRSNAAEAKDGTQQTGKQAVTNAQNVEALKSTDNVAQESVEDAAMQKAGAVAAATPAPVQAGTLAGPAGQGQGGYRNTTNYAQQARVVNGRAFYQNNGTWTDSNIQANAKLKQTNIKLGSDEYFQLLKDHPETAQWLSLGNQVDLQIGDTVVSVR